MEERALRNRRWALLAVLLVIMVAMSGCFGGRPRPRGDVEGCVTVNSADADITEPDIQIVAPSRLAIIDDPPLKGAKVTIGGRSAITGTDGHFWIGGVPAGRQRLEVVHPEFRAYSVYVDIEPNIVNYVSEKVYGVGYYLIIGVQNFDDNFENGLVGLPKDDLKGTFNDVSYILDWLVWENRLKTDLAVVLHDPTATEVLAEVESLAKQLRPRDYLVIYFSGHAISQRTHGRKIDGLACYDRILTDGELEEALSYAGSDDITLILDGCFTGSFFDGIATDPFQSKAFLYLPYTILAGSTTGSPAYEVNDPQYGNIGLLTKHLVNGLRTRQADRNADGRITASEIYNYAKPLVRTESKYFSDGEQLLDFYRSSTDPVIFTYRR